MPGLARLTMFPPAAPSDRAQYVAPEVIVGQKGHEYGSQVDMWSAGVVLFILLGGYPPFWSDSEPQLFEQIRKGKFSFEDPVWVGVSERWADGQRLGRAIQRNVEARGCTRGLNLGHACSQKVHWAQVAHTWLYVGRCGPAHTSEPPTATTRSAKELIRKLLHVDPTKRLSAHEALHHPWVTATTSVAGGASKSGPALAGTQNNLKKHFPRRKFKAVVGSVIAANRCAGVGSRKGRAFRARVVRSMCG